MTDSVWCEFFDSCASQYMNQAFTADSVREVAFLVDVLDVPAGASILDFGHGTGRHAVELAQRGFHVTGPDLSAGMLAEAAMAAEEAGVEHVWGGTASSWGRRPIDLDECEIMVVMRRPAA